MTVHNCRRPYIHRDVRCSSFPAQLEAVRAAPGYRLILIGAARYYSSHIRFLSPSLSVLLSHNIDGMVVVASGVMFRVRDWSGILRTAAIQYAVVDCQFEDPYTPTDHAEIWVEQNDIEEARTALRNPNSDESLIC